MSLYNYVDVPNPNLICCICRAPFTTPITASTCLHTFCSACITRALSFSPTCPVDRAPLRAADLGPADPIIRCMVDELIVECVYRMDGCAYTGQRQGIAAHLRDECAYAEVECEEHEEGEGGEICGTRVTRRDLRTHLVEVHRKGSEEEAVLEEAEAEIGEQAEEQKEESHTCPHASVGCPYTGPLSAAQHLSSCPYESLKGFFTANSSKVSVLTEQNIVLRYRVDSLESTVNTLRKEMSAARNALGPWFRSSHLAMNSAGGEHGGSRRGSEAHAGPSTRVDESAVAVDELASYFPSEVAVGGGAGGAVAPLDLGTTLEGTLRGLRESVVGVAAGVDSVGRRSEIGLANETLRLGEEMMSVRAQMHGLRMQVHGMMMDRNAVLSMRESERSFGGPGSITKL